MLDFGLLREVLQSLNKNKLRTLLSGFTVAFAIMLFTILFGIANGFQNTFENEFAGDANNSIFIYSGRTSKPVVRMRRGRTKSFQSTVCTCTCTCMYNESGCITLSASCFVLHTAQWY